MAVEVAMVGLDVWVQAAYFAVGLVMIGLAALLQWTKMHQPGVSSQPNAHHLA